MIKQSGKWALVGPRNTWDTNYHLVDVASRVDHLIDIHDISSSPDEDGLLWDDLLDLSNVEDILSHSWKSVALEY